MKYEPYICDQFPWIDVLLHSLGDTKKFRKSQIEDFRAAPFVTVWIIACSINAMERVVSY